MGGRIENEIKINNNIQAILTELPEYVSSYYYNIQISLSPLSCLEYLRRIKHFLNYINVDINDVDDMIIGKYFKHIKYSGNNKTSEAYNKFVWTVLNRFFKYLYDKKIIESNPMKLIKRTNKKDDVKRYYLTMDDLGEILKSSMNGCGSDYSKKRQQRWKERDYAILFLLMSTGMRRTALSEINIDDINFTIKKIRVVDKRDKLQVYDITDDMEEVLLKWLSQREKILNGKKCDALFISANGNRLVDKSIYRIVQKYSNDALGYKISPHKLRAAFASLYYEQSGHDIEATRVAVGHEDISTTSIYINKNNDARMDATNFMSKGLSKITRQN